MTATILQFAPIPKLGRGQRPPRAPWLTGRTDADRLSDFNAAEVARGLITEGERLDRIRLADLDRKAGEFMAEFTKMVNDPATTHRDLDTITFAKQGAPSMVETFDGEFIEQAKEGPRITIAQGLGMDDPKGVA